MTVEYLIDELSKIKDKTKEVELYDISSGERYPLLDVDIIYDGDPLEERNIDFNFES